MNQQASIFQQLHSKMEHSINALIGLLFKLTSKQCQQSSIYSQSKKKSNRSCELTSKHDTLMKALEKEISYHFRNPQLLIEALTHSSIAFDQGHNPFDNERLEFLGDAVLQLVITRHIFHLFPHFHEGQLTKIRTRLVSRTALKAYAAHLDLGKYLIMGRGEEASGGRQRSSILGDSFEALIGAIYLDGGLDAAQTFILKEAEGHLNHAIIEPEEINPKGHLQEHLQSLAPSPPIYELIEERGASHSKCFRYRVLWEGKELGIGEGRSKKEAEVAAAMEALKTVNAEKEKRQPQKAD